VAARGAFRYEVHELADGADLYRDALSWTGTALLDRIRRRRN
jgi:hypothetical protein